MKNQFRSLDEDEVEFLDSVLESTRAKEAEVKRDTNHQLDAFRRQQEEAEKSTNQSESAEQPDTGIWKAGPRKRKKGREAAIGGIKLRRISTTEKTSDTVVEGSAISENVASSPVEDLEEVEAQADALQERRDSSNAQPKEEPGAKSPRASTAGLGLAAYSSDEDD